MSTLRADDYDLGGFAVGAVERNLMLPTPDIGPGDVLLGLPSTGVHSNGFSLVRKVVARSGLAYSDPCPWNASVSLGEDLLTPTRIYIKQLLPGIRASLFKGMSHITGGGFIENIPRVLPDGVACEIDAATWAWPGVFRWLSEVGEVEPLEMARTFNNGVGMVVVVAKDKVDEALQSLRDNGEPGAFVVGKLTEGKGVQMVNLDSWKAKA